MLLYLIYIQQIYSFCKNTFARLDNNRLFANIFIVIANLLKNKKNNKVIQITKDKYITKILKYINLIFLKIVIIINILII